MENIDFGMDFVIGNSKKKMQELGLGKKNHLNPRCVHTWANGTNNTNV